MAGTPPSTVLVTGGNRGLGLEVCRQLAAQGARVLLAARSAADAAQASAALGGAPVEPTVLDVTDTATLARCVETLRAGGVTLDALVNNAAVSLDGFDAEVVRHTLDVNVQGPLRVTDALRPLLAPGARVVMVSSGMGDLSILSRALQAAFTAEDLTREGVLALAQRFQADVAAGRERQAGWPRSAYSVSKTLLNALVRALAREPGLADLRLNAVCPGWVRTRMGGRGAPRSVEQGAAGLVWAATLPPDGPTGGFFRDGKAIAW